MDEADAPERIRKLLLTGDNRLKQGVAPEKVRETYEEALAVAREAGLEEHFMGYGPSQVRFVGHGVGLELDELPVLSPNDLVLEDGMVFALEPKFVFPDLGAIGIENTWLVGAEGAERLTRASEDIVVV